MDDEDRSEERCRGFEYSNVIEAAYIEKNQNKKIDDEKRDDMFVKNLEGSPFPERNKEGEGKRKNKKGNISSQKNHAFYGKQVAHCLVSWNVGLPRKIYHSPYSIEILRHL